MMATHGVPVQVDVLVSCSVAAQHLSGCPCIFSHGAPNASSILFRDTSPELDRLAILEAYSSPFHVAICLGQTQAARLLLEAGADPDASCSHEVHGQHTPLDMAIIYDQTECLQLLLEHGADPDGDPVECTPLRRTIMCDYNVGFTRLLLQHGADPDLTGTPGYEWTPLHRAVANGQVEFTQLLLKHGADVHAVSDTGTELEATPLLGAFLYNHGKAGFVETVRTLLEQGASVHDTLGGTGRGSGRTSLHLASQWNDVAIMRLLLHHGAGVQAEAAGGLTPLHLAVSGKQQAAVEFLLLNGANVHAENMNGMTPLMLSRQEELLGSAPALAGLLQKYA